MFVFGDDHHSLVGADGGARSGDRAADGRSTASDVAE